MLKSLFAVAITSTALFGQSLSAHVDDPLSHGAVGDQRLSLDEAIRLANGTLAMAALSPAEQARVTGSGMHVLEIAVDPMATPAITLESPLTEIHGPGHLAGELIVRGGSHMGMTMIHGGSHATVFALRTQFARIEGFHVMGGQVAVDARMAPAGMPGQHMADVHGCMFEQQGVAAVRLHGALDDESMLMLEHCEFSNLPVGILIDDRTATGMCMGELEFVAMDGVALGCDVADNGNGLMSMLFVFRSSFANGSTLARMRRTPTSTNQFMFRFVHCDVTCDADVLDIQGTANGLTMVHHHHSDFVAGPGRKAFWVWPRTAEFDIHGSEMVFDGDVHVAGNRFTMRVWQQNNDYVNSSIVYDVDGALPNLLWNRYTNCSFDVPATARSPVTVRSSEFSGTAVTGNSILAPIQLLGCWRSGGTLNGLVTESQPAPARFLGTTLVGEQEPQIGSALHLSTDLPSNLGVVWDVMLSESRPVTTAEPVRLYGDLGTAFLLHGVYALQSQVAMPLPNDPNLVGLEFYVQAIAFPFVAQPHIPVFHLPRGSLVRPRV
ncbi:MAG: hypothetical protein IT457_17130 [Planctomycetes bacterium]|nr:hypothetical protein [Planctomycetota bacterium]